MMTMMIMMVTMINLTEILRSNNPDWVQDMFGEDFVQAVTDRVTFAVQHFDGQVMMIMMLMMLMMTVMIMMMRSLKE